MMEREKISNDQDEIVEHENHSDLDDDSTEIPVEPEEKVIEANTPVDHNGTEEKNEVAEKSSETPEVTAHTESPEEKSEVDKKGTETPEITAHNESTEEKPAAEQRDNVAYLNSQIEKLIALKAEKNFSDFWFYVRELNKMIFTVRGLHKEERLKFKERIGELCDETKKIQEEYKNKISKTSSLKLEQIKRIIDEAIGFGTSHEELEKSFHKIEEANKFFKEGKVHSEGGEESADMSREDREQAKELIKAGKDKILDRKREIREGNFKAVTEKLTSISDQLLSSSKTHKVFDAIKKLRIDMKQMILDRSQLREIDDVIETIWKKAREKSSAGRVHDTKNKIDGLNDLVRRKEKFILTLEKEIKDLNDKWNNVRNDFFKNRVNEWIEEKKEKIESTYKEIDSVREKITFLTEQMKRN